MSLPAGPSQTDSGRLYRNPPVVEAFCEVYFTSSNWDDTIPDLFYEQVKDRFPSQEEPFSRQVDLTLDVPNDKFSSAIQPGPFRKLFRTAEGDQIIQIAENLFVFNQLTPYSSFQSWETDFYEVLDIYVKLVSPHAVDRLGVRYLNHVSVPERRFQMSDYFTVFPVIPLGSGNAHGNFLINCVIPQSDEGHFLTFSFSKIVPEPPDETSQTFLLDLYDQAFLGRTLSESEFKSHVRVAHGNVVQAFEGSITDRLRALFNEE